MSDDQNKPTDCSNCGYKHRVNVIYSLLQKSSNILWTTQFQDLNSTQLCPFMMAICTRVHYMGNSTLKWTLSKSICQKSCYVQTLSNVCCKSLSNNLLQIFAMTVKLSVVFLLILQFVWSLLKLQHDYRQTSRVSKSFYLFTIIISNWV
jgi:hypothetical protein